MPNTPPMDKQSQKVPGTGSGQKGPQPMSKPMAPTNAPSKDKK
ncbi:MAG: hypothetical protein ABUL73_06280 [Alphaproteobacteria bacterium]